MLELTTDTQVDIARSSLAHGGGVFETVCIHKGIPLFLEHHMDRMKSGIASLGMEPPPDTPTVRRFISRWLETINLQEGAIRVLAADARLMVMTRDTYTPPRSVAIGVATGFIRCRRSRLAGIKSANYLENRLVTAMANRDGLFDRIAPNDAGQLTDGGRCNLFVGLNSVLYTPPVADGALPGIVRNILLDGGIGDESSVTPDDLMNVQCAFVTSSLAGVIPVHEIDGFRKLPTDHDLLRQAATVYGNAVNGELAAYGED